MMKKLILFAMGLLVTICALHAAEPVTLTWTLSGVESTQSGVVLDNYPVVMGEGSASGSWVLVSTSPSYAKTTTEVVTSGSTKVLQLGRSSVSAVGTSLKLAQEANPIPADATINSVKVLMKSYNTESTWTVSVGENKSAPLTAASGGPMDAYGDLKFDELNFTGNDVSLNFESMATAKRYVYIAEISVTYTPAEVSVPEIAGSCDWSFAGVESRQSNVVLTNYPVILADGSASGQWVLNSTEPSYAKTSTTWVTTGSAKTLQLGSGSYSPVGTTLSLTADANPIPANATIKNVELLVKSVTTESVWSVSVNGVKSASSQTAPSATAMGDCTTIRFEGINLQGNLISFAIESMAASGKYVFVAGATVEYTAPAGETPKEKVATPEFNPVSGAAIESGSIVTLSTATPDAVMHYALGQLAFTETVNGTVKIEGAVGSIVTLQAYASKEGMADSDIASATYTIKAPAIKPPYDETFDAETSLSAWTIADADGDRSTWKYYSVDNSMFIEHQIGNQGKNDWLISPALDLESTSTYTLRFDVKAGNADYPEKIAVALGTEAKAEAMTLEILPVTIVDNAEYRTISCTFTPATSGENYIGFHAVSDAGMYRLFIDNVRLTAGISSLAPAAVDEVLIVNSPDGENKATITFAAPAKSISGENLTAISAIKVSRGGVLVKTFDNPTPGATLTFTDEVTTPGEYTYSIVASNDKGEGVDTELKAFVGINIPLGPTEAVFTEPEAGTVLVTWSAPTKTIYGDAINPSLIHYTIRDTEGNTLAENIEGTSWQSKIVEDGEQKLSGFRVYASTSAGINADEYASTDVRPIGTAYALPYVESFGHWTASKLAEIIASEESRTTWRVLRELIETGVQAFDADDGILAFMPEYVGNQATYRTGKIAIPATAVNPMLTFMMNNAVGSENILEVTITAEDGTQESKQIKPDWDGWKEQLVELKDFAGKEVRISFTATAGTTARVMALDLIEVKEIAAYDLSVARFRVPLEMELMRQHTVTVTVRNTGIERAFDYSVDLYCDGDIIETKRPERLDRNESVEVNFTVTPSRGDKSAYKAVVNFAQDTELANNSTEDFESEIIRPLYSPVENLQANVSGLEVTLSWDAPSASANTTAVTETFERYDEFVINNAGEWTFYDVDGGATYGISDGLHSFPNMGEPMAFIVFNGTIPTLDTIGSITFGAYSGKQYLASFSVRGGEVTNNDWLVSPMLNGSAQKVSFYIRSMSIGAHEKFEFLTSSTGKAVEDFVKLGEGEDYASKWTVFEFDIPQGSRYFAIRCVSHDQFAFFLDDVTYIPATSEVDNIIGYDIYRDGDKINEEPITETTYTDKEADAGNHQYQVYAVMPRGLSDPAEISMELSGIEGVSADNDAEEVYNLQGVYLGNDTKGLPSGVYIVRQGSNVRKIRF